MNSQVCRDFPSTDHIAFSHLFAGVKQTPQSQAILRRDGARRTCGHRPEAGRSRELFVYGDACDGFGHEAAAAKSRPGTFPVAFSATEDCVMADPPLGSRQ